MNRSNFVHGACALAAQFVGGLILQRFGVPAIWAWWIAGAAAMFFFVGVEWMQQVRVNLAEEGRTWPTRLSLVDVLRGFVWTKIDRYGDAGLPVLFCSAFAMWNPSIVLPPFL